MTSELKNKYYKLTISIVCDNQVELLDKCLESIYSTTKKTAFQIFVVDNLAPNSIKGVFEKYNKVVQIKNNKKLGYAANHNQVIRQSQSDYVLLLNDDTVLINDCIDTLVEYMDNHLECGIIAPKIVFPDGTPQSNSGYFTSFLTEMLYWSLFLVKFGKESYKRKKHSDCFANDTLKNVEWLSGIFWLARVSLFKNVGYLNEDIFMYNEDVEWCARLHRSKMGNVVFNPKATIIHYGGKSTDDSSNIKVIYALEGAYHYLKTEYGLLCSKTFVVSCIVLWPIQIVLSKVILKNKNFDMKKDLYMQLMRTAKGLINK